MAQNPLIEVSECAKIVGVAKNTYITNYASLEDHPAPCFRYPLRYSRKEWMAWLANRCADQVAQKA